MKGTGALPAQDTGVLVGVSDCHHRLLEALARLYPGRAEVQPQEIQNSGIGLGARRKVSEYAVREASLGSLKESVVRHQAGMTGGTRCRLRLEHTLLPDDVPAPEWGKDTLA